jgi:hypothetical protein
MSHSGWETKLVIAAIVIGWFFAQFKSWICVVLSVTFGMAVILSRALGEITSVVEIRNIIYVIYTMA